MGGAIPDSIHIASKAFLNSRRLVQRTISKRRQVNLCDDSQRRRAEANLSVVY